MKLYKEKKKHLVILASDLKDGQIAIILNWTDMRFNSRIVQRCGLDLISLGLPIGNSFVSFFTAHSVKGCTVRVLKPGTKLVV